MTSPTIYLISGASRGIGFGLVQALSQRPNTIVFAGARDPAAATALQALAKEKPEAVHVVKLTSADVEDNKAAVEEIRTKAGQLDVVIANAGIAQHYGLIVSTPVEQFKTHFEVNTIGPIVLFQAAHSLLIQSPSGKPQFSVISSGVGSISLEISIQAAAYGMSKTAVNYLVKQLHLEHASEGLITIAINPGWVDTDMGSGGAKANGMDRAPVDLGTSVAGILGIVDGATRDKSSGKFLNAVVAAGSDKFWDVAEEELPW